MAPNLTPEQRDVLEHVARYRVTTVDAVHRVLYAERTRDGATKALARLVEADLLQVNNRGRRNFYQLTKRSAGALGAPANAADPLQTQGLYEHYGVLAFCCLCSVPRTLITAAEFSDGFPQLVDTPGIKPSHQSYYIDDDGASLRLARITIDAGGDSTRLVQKCRDIIRHAAESPGLRDMLKRGYFALTVLTPEEPKRDALAAKLAAVVTAAHLRVEVVPELKHVM